MKLPKPTSGSTPFFFRRWKTLLVLLAVGVGAYFGLRRFQQWRDYVPLAEALAETDLLDPGWRFEDMEANQPTVASDDDGGPRLIEIAKMLPKDFPTWKEARFPGQAEGTTEGELTRLEEDFASSLLQVEQNQILNKQQDEAIEAKLRNHTKTLEKALELREFSGGRLWLTRGKKLDASSNLLQEIRRVGDLLSLEVMRQLQKRDWPRALAACEAMLHVGRCIGDEPDTSAQLNRMAMQGRAVGHLERTLAQGNPSPEGLTKFQPILEREWREEFFLPAVRGDRAWEHRFYEQVHAGEVDMAEFANQIAFLKKLAVKGGEKEIDASDKDYFWIRWFRRSPNYFGAHATSLRRHNELVEIARKPIDEQLPRVRECFARPLHPDEAPWSMMEKMHNAALRNKMKLKMCMVAIAAEIFRQRHSRWPKGFAELIPEYLPEAPVDYFDGKPIRFLRLRDGIVLYSVGPSQTELADSLQGKSIVEVEDNAIGSLEYIFRLWDSERRRHGPQAELKFEAPKDDDP